jgi:membrane associated rhomboid family serine protease
MDSKPNPPSPGEDRDWIERVVAATSALGMSPVRVRWKLQRLQKGWNASMRRTEQRIQHVRYEHQVCRACGAIQDRAIKRCERCGASMGTRVGHVLERLGVFAPARMSLSLALGAVLVMIHARVTLASPGAWWALPSEALIHFGSTLPAGVGGEEWWRPATSVFLHANLWHLAFNLFALASVGPLVERAYGRANMLALFLITGALASLGSMQVGGGIGIGASGAIMGLVGVVAGHGQRQGTRAGREERNAMLKWSLYVFVFGYFIGADNLAHAIGLAGGLVAGFAVRPAALRAPRWRVPVLVLGMLGVLGTAATVVAVMVPVSKPAEEVFSDVTVRFGEAPDAD